MTYGTFPAPENACRDESFIPWGLRILYEIFVCALAAFLILFPLLRLCGIQVAPLKALEVSFAFTCLLIAFCEAFAAVCGQRPTPEDDGPNAKCVPNPRILKDAESRSGYQEVNVSKLPAT
ncbi:hypothetical protein DFH07DRAFT_846727 [Mycena maculata]|uniref:Uncharacterized protein n=1 Tax=Mycena maculata TaxID=230809 RepID=A0AAD7I1Z1_9AGAR|nr:hypothetical protein DFH07DRAFT_846727 [Mycena maculata]